MDGMESSVRLLATLVKCLSGIRRGDQNRVRLALSEKKLALRSKVVAIECEIYEKEKAAQEELERKERRRKRSQLSERGQMDLLRGNLFGPDLVVAERERVLAEREKETKRLQKELEILKEKMPESRLSSNGKRTKDGGSKMENGGLPANSGQKGASGAAAASGAEHMSVNPSPSDQSAMKENGGLNMDNGAHPAPAKAGTANGATGRREEAEDIRFRQGFRLHCVSTRRVDATREAKKFDVEAALREVRQIKEELAALQVELPVSESSPDALQEQNNAGGESEPEFSTLPPSSDYGATGSWEAQTQWLEKFPEAALRELERIKKELACTQSATASEFLRAFAGKYCRKRRMRAGFFNASASAELRRDEWTRRGGGAKRELKIKKLKVKNETLTTIYYYDRVDGASIPMGTLAKSPTEYGAARQRPPYLLRTTRHRQTSARQGVAKRWFAVSLKAMHKNSQSGVVHQNAEVARKAHA